MKNKCIANQHDEIYNFAWYKKIEELSGQQGCTCENYAISCNWCSVWNREESKTKINPNWRNIKKEYRIKPIFKWFDFWVGLFWDSKKSWLYIFPIPMFGFIIKIKW